MKTHVTELNVYSTGRRSVVYFIRGMRERHYHPGHDSMYRLNRAADKLQRSGRLALRPWPSSRVGWFGDVKEEADDGNVPH